MPFLFCYNEPLCGDGSGAELCVPARRTAPGDSRAHLPGLLKAKRPRVRGEGNGAAAWS